MSKSNYLDIKAIKKHTRELRRNVTDSEKELWDNLETEDFQVTNFFVSIQLYIKPTTKD